MVAFGTPDMQGSREQQVWFRYQQIECAGSSLHGNCALVGRPQYWDTFWWTQFPNDAVNTPASGFYASLLATRRWWNAELLSERIMELRLPSPSTTNGTWLITQVFFLLFKCLIVHLHIKFT